MLTANADQSHFHEMKAHRSGVAAAAADPPCRDIRLKRSVHAARHGDPSPDRGLDRVRDTVDDHAHVRVPSADHLEQKMVAEEDERSHCAEVTRELAATACVYRDGFAWGADQAH